MKRSIEELRADVEQMYRDQVNPEYVGWEMEQDYHFAVKCVALMAEDYDEHPEEYDENADENILEDLQKSIDRNYKSFLNPETAIVGEGATVCLYSDRHAYTIIGKSKTGKKLTLRQCKATLVPSFVPTFVEGGFSGHCTNQEDQEYTYEEDPEGEVITAYWSDRERRYNASGLHVVKGRREFYDYNF